MSCSKIGIGGKHTSVSITDDSWVLLEETSSSILSTMSPPDPAPPSTSASPPVCVSGSLPETGKPLLARIISRNEECWEGIEVEGNSGLAFTGDFDCDLSKNPLRMLALKVVVWSISGVSTSESPVRSIVSGTLDV